MRVEIRRALLGVFWCASATVGMGAALPAAAGAYATIAPPPQYSSVPGLPDGRVYEWVTPGDKYGYGVETSKATGPLANATADGDGILYKGEGPLAEGATSGVTGTLFVSQRTTGGWSTRAATPRGAPGLHEPEENNEFFAQSLDWVFPSSDLSHLAFSIGGADVGPPDKRGLANNLFLAGPDPSVEPVWVGRTEVPQPQSGVGLALLGGTPDLSTLYFAFDGSLLPEGQASSSIYEYRDGVLSDVAVLPDGSISQQPAGSAAAIDLFEGFPSTNPDQMDGEVSADGSRVFFLTSPAPSAPAELYARETLPDGSQRTVLVSQSQLPGHMGEPAPDGPQGMANTAPTPARIPAVEYAPEPGDGSYVFASSDGSHAFFYSVDRLTVDAPSEAGTKVYAFDLETGTLEYLPGVEGSIVVAARDGSSFVFENTTTSPFELDRWVAGPDGGSVIAIAKLPGPAKCGPVCVGSARVSSDGSVVVFATEAPIDGFNDGGGFQQIFRYDATSSELSCVSCPPKGVAPSGNAVMSIADYSLGVHHSSAFQNDDVVDDRGMSADGSRVFFDTPDPLVPQDVNGRRDVYEWEKGRVFLLSAGSSPEDSFFLDSSESSGDVFFATTSELVPGDDDGAYDIYDARIPRPGDNPPPSAVPCQGEVCQGPPSVPQLLNAPSSATFSGLGNQPSEVGVAVAVKKAKQKPKPRRCGKGRTLRHGTCSKKGTKKASRGGR